jgi:hypothetical protein
MSRCFRLPLLACACVCASLSLRAEEVEVANVRFNNVKAPGGANGTWFEADIALDVRPAPGPTHMVSRVRVTLTLAFEIPGTTAGAERRLDHYRAEAECVALDPGRTEVRFYLPAELVKRDQLHADPKYWQVDISVGGHPLPPGRASFSAALAAPESRRTFQSKAAAAAAPNDGLLQPQYLTPFANEYPRNTPSFVRRDPR